MSTLRSFAGSDIGLVRTENEDSYLLFIPDDKDLLLRKGILAVVADGVGGGPAGKRASSMAVESVQEAYYRHPGEDNVTALRESLQSANIRVRKEAHQVPEFHGMATTCTAFALCKNEGYLAHAGDSRAYLLSGDTLRQLSMDHTLVNELVGEGIISPEEAKTHPQRNFILKALGTAGHLEPDTERIDLVEGDILLLCSDGLHGQVADAEIASVLLGNTVEDAGRKLIDLALARGGPDNITAVIVRI